MRFCLVVEGSRIARARSDALSGASTMHDGGEQKEAVPLSGERLYRTWSNSFG